MSESEYAAEPRRSPLAGCTGRQGVSPARGLDPKGVEEAGGFHGVRGYPPRGYAAGRRKSPQPRRLHVEACRDERERVRGQSRDAAR